jgi:hypothetical protein
MEDERAQEEVVLEESQDDLVVDLLTGKERRRTEKEVIVQRMIEVLAGEYRYPLDAMERDVSVATEVDGRRRTRTADVVVYTPASRTFRTSQSAFSWSSRQARSPRTATAAWNC